MRFTQRAVLGIAAVASVAAPSAGCLSIATQTSVREEPGAISRRSGRLPDRNGSVVAELQGTVLELQVKTEAICYDESYREIRRTQVDERQIADSGFPWYVTEWTCGVGCTLGGVTALILAPGLSSETTDPSTGEGSTLSDQMTAYLSGGGGVGLGVGMLIAAIVETVRARDSESPLPNGEETLERTTRPCDAQPAPGVPVEGMLGGRTMSLGVTDTSGGISLDLRQVIPAGFLAGLPQPAALALRVRGAEVGRVDLTEYVSALDQEAWTMAMGRATADSFGRYLQEFPRGLYVAEARRQIEQLAWTQASSLDTVEAYRDYLASNADGIHASEGRNRLDELAWAVARAGDQVAGYEQYLADSPDGARRNEAMVRVVQLLIDDKQLSDAEGRLEASLELDPGFEPDAAPLQEQIDELRAQAARRIDQAIAEALRIAGRCGGTGPGTGDVQIAAQAYRKLFSVRREASGSRIQDGISQILSRCGACSPDCAGVR
jgi:hypothetical protein